VVTSGATSPRELVAEIPDPEIPVVTIEDLGILRSVEVEESGCVVVTVTPTYSGCPAMDAIRTDIEATLRRAGYGEVRVDTTFLPAWTTDWITERGRDRLHAYGIAPPIARTEDSGQTVQLVVSCPRCGSTSTRLVSRFGSTACKAHRVCADCLEPFDHFKTL
jgi:ring-1,2-phenylacetyl-CoA epoxidase subunit PaaD